MTSYFGCVVDRFGFSSDFKELQAGMYAMAFPAVEGLGHISVFVMDSTCLSSASVEVSLLYGETNERIGYLTDYSPSLTFRPRFPLVPFEIRFIIVPPEQVDPRIPYYPTDMENMLIDMTKDVMLRHLEQYLTPRLVLLEGVPCFLIRELENWAERFQKEMKHQGFWLAATQ
ncbi:hypothetical protein GMRT_14493 [Giardia muris]|uniref:Uncharacterized protein n=1 Tax=Giardia muris TaxID=5742 RepID=A0A4Z1T0P0_GIAMU|nr:hypothetical protein GMRT_14493 [Giardia muris]|eukprot:TNJ29268.1 hypothetical protein GMRT_14493 [Giardia muris]